ncbi:MAG: YraN family protein [Muribaculaceae bacterium]|jgi:putative endonuclease|nr:YraN family protein [Muribaculaceae bacterium]
MARHNIFGHIGEQAARDFLITRGLIVREQNWKLNHLEIDIVAEEPEKSLLHIVEVKTRSNVGPYDPLKAIDAKKQRNLINAANGYIKHYKLNMGVQFDVMIITGNVDDLKIEYIPRAFYPRLRTYR